MSLLRIAAWMDRAESGFLGDRPHEAADGQDLAPLPWRELGGRDDESLDLGRMRAKAVGRVVVGPLDTAEQTMGGGRHSPILSATPPP